MAGGPGPGGAGLEPRIARLLTAGTYGAIALLAIGVLGMLATGLSPLADGPSLDVARLAADLLRGQPTAFLWLGLLVVVVTPTARVVVALLAFARRDEPRLAAVAAGILGVILLSVVLAQLAEV